MSHRQLHDPVQRLNDHHADDLLAVARAFGGHPDATSARAEHIDLDGVDLAIDTPDGPATVRLAFTQPAATPARRRLAFRDLARRAHAALAADDDGSPS